MRLNHNCLEKIYFSFINDPENNIETDEMKETSDAMYQLMGNLVPKKKEFIELEEKVLDYAGASEKYGFIAGFEWCMSLFVNGLDV